MYTDFRDAIINCITRVPSGYRCCSEGFADCGVAGAVDMPDWDVSKLTQFSNMFAGLRAFNQDISRWNTSSAVNMRGAFEASVVFNGDISHWDVSNVRYMEDMFKNAVAFNSDISMWNVGKVVDARSMFKGNAVFNQDITKWQLTNDRYGSTNMFDGATAWHNTFINCGYDASARIRYALCKSAGSVTMSHGPGYGPPSAWKVIPPFSGTLPPLPPAPPPPPTPPPSPTTPSPPPTQKSNPFTSYSNLRQAVKNCIAKVLSGDSCCSRTDHADCGEAGRIDIPNWDVSQITSFLNKFAEAFYFNQDLSSWDTGMATTMYAMFDYAHAFNGDISDWNTTNVVDMKFMFYEARAFDGDISRWQRRIKSGSLKRRRRESEPSSAGAENPGKISDNFAICHRLWGLRRG